MTQDSEPTETVRPDSADQVFLPPNSRIVVGLDGSPDSLQALRAAVRIASMSGAVLHVLAVCTIPSGIEFQMEGLDGWNPGEETRSMLEVALQEAFGGNRPATIRSEVRFGNPGQEILQAAQDAALIVIGSRGHGSFVGMLLGSVSLKCVAAAPCPVMIVHALRQTPVAGGQGGSGGHHRHR